MQYACKLELDEKPKVIKWTKSATIYNKYLTLDILSEYIKDGEKFDIYFSEGEGFQGDIYLLEIYCERLETPDETQKRIDGIKRYNANYEIFHAKYKNNSTK